MGCNCNSTCTSNQLPIGIQGEDGAQGIFGGFSAEWVFSTSTSATPSSTQLRLNATNYSLVTEIYISDTGTGSINLDAFLDSLSNTSNYGYVRIFKKSDSTKFWMGEITAVTDNGADHTLAVTYITSNSSFAASDAVVLTFAPRGTVGPDVLYNTTTAATTSNAAMAILQTYTIAAGKLASNGDYVEIVGLYEASATTEIKDADIRIGGTVCHSKVALLPMQVGVKYMRVCLRATRKTSTTMLLDFKTTCVNNLYQDVTGGVSFFEAAFSVSDLSANTTTIELRGKNTSAGTETIGVVNMVVTYFKL